MSTSSKPIISYHHRSTGEGRDKRVFVVKNQPKPEAPPPLAILCLDFEAYPTDGVYQRSGRTKHRVWEIAACDLGGQRTFTRIIRTPGKPDDPTYPWKAATERGIDLESDVHPDFGKAWYEFYYWAKEFTFKKCKAKELILVAHNGNQHDFLILEVELKRAMTVCDMSWIHLVDSIPVLKRNMEIKSYAREALVLEFCGLKQPDNHHALADARSLATVLVYLMGWLGLNFQELARLLKADGRVISVLNNTPTVPYVIFSNDCPPVNGPQPRWLTNVMYWIWASTWSIWTRKR